ncbi:MAG: hypothetical protein NMNS02_01220 [Nitrosomonas sp.]|nr:MAG: hypothetical protein NMNS02_01220 [Nitrosomonas sp.]
MNAMNMDGTATIRSHYSTFYRESVSVDPSLMQQLIVFITAMLAAMGAPGTPAPDGSHGCRFAGCRIACRSNCHSYLPVDRLLDTIRTMANVEDDMVGSLVVQK